MIIQKAANTIADGRSHANVDDHKQKKSKSNKSNFPTNKRYIYITKNSVIGNNHLQDLTKID